MNEYAENQTEASVIADILAHNSSRALAVGKPNEVILHNATQVLDLEKFAYTPRRMKGTFPFRDIDSLLTYCDEQRRDVDVPAGIFLRLCASERSITATLNESQNGAADWGDWKAEVRFEFHRVFKAWLNNCAIDMTQTQFADFIEDHIADVVSPIPSTLLDLANCINVARTVKFKSKRNPANGTFAIAFSEEEGGDEHTAALPDTIEIAVPIWAGDSSQTPRSITLKLRAVARDGKAAISMRIDQYDAVMTTLWEEIEAQVKQAVEDRPTDGNYVLLRV